MEIKNFITKAVLANAVFPPLVTGGTSVTIQQLIHGYTILSLENYADQMEKKIDQSSRKARREGKTEAKVFQDISYREFVEFLDYLIQLKTAKAEEFKRNQRIAELQRSLGDLETPEEKRLKLEQELKSLQESEKTSASPTEIQFL